MIEARRENTRLDVNNNCIFLKQLWIGIIRFNLNNRGLRINNNKIKMTKNETLMNLAQ